jgi:hypothetical protein
VCTTFSFVVHWLLQVFCAFAAVEWKYCSPGGGLVPLAGGQPSAEADTADIELESEYLIP